MLNLLKYKGFLGSVRFDDDYMCLHGVILFIDALVMYEAIDTKGIKKEFEEAVDFYISDTLEMGLKVQGCFEKEIINQDLRYKGHSGSVYYNSVKGIFEGQFFKKHGSAFFQASDPRTIKQQFENAVEEYFLILKQKKARKLNQALTKRYMQKHHSDF